MEKSEVWSFEVPVRDWKSAQRIAQVQYKLALAQLQKMNPQMVEANAGNSNGPKVDVIIIYDQNKGEAQMGRLTATPLAFHKALQDAYMHIEGDAEELRRKLATLMPLTFASPKSDR